MFSFFAKIIFMSKFLDSCRKKWHQFGRNKDCHKILHDISNKWTVNKTDQDTGQDIYQICISSKTYLFVSVTEWIKIVIIFFIVNVINNASFKFNIAMPLYMIFRSVSYLSKKKEYNVLTWLETVSTYSQNIRINYLYRLPIYLLLICG